MELDFSNAVHYHLGGFPPKELESSNLLIPLSSAVEALARYDVMLRQMRDSEILLSSLRRQEAVISSRMEGTITTLEEVLSAEADQESEDFESGNYRHEAIEALAYSSAMRNAQFRLEQGGRISEHLIKSTHERLLRFARGNHLAPGEYKVDQNYLADRSRKRILFVPINPEQLPPHMEALVRYIEESDDHPLIKAAVSHIEFEALHPFNDGNGRMGRMLITLYLWQSRVISAPHFYVSEYFEENRDEYIDRMREVSKSGDWTQWVVFFLNGISDQAARKAAEIENIQFLYENMQTEFRDILASKDFMSALNFVFSSPYFRSTRFARDIGTSRATATRFLRLLRQHDLIRVVEPGSGRRAAMYAFTPLLEVLRN